MAECCEDTIISVFPKLFGEIFSKTNQEPNRQIQIIDDCVFFKYLVPRGEAYDKKYKEKLQEDDK